MSGRVYRRRANSHSGRIIIAVTVYLVGFTLLLLAVSHFYLIPAYKAFAAGNPAQQKALSITAALVLTLILFILLAGLLLSFRVGRFFWRKTSHRPAPTKYTDAWKESGRRMELPNRDEPE